FHAVRLAELPLPHPRQFCFRYTILELNTAVKPWMFEHLFARGYDRVVYLDPDIFVYSPLVELDEVPPDNFITLTPHLTGFIHGDEHPSERTIMLAGAYNLGFIAVSRRPQLASFLRWWQEKLEFQCVVDTARGLFVDQKWIDLVPGLFSGVSILRHDGYNVAYWNLGQRTVTAGSSPAVNGKPLRFFHFSGFDPAVPDMVSKHHHVLRIEDAGDVRALLEDYDAALRTADYSSSRNAPYSFGVFSDGTPVPDAARIAYRNSIELQSAAGPDPFSRPELFVGIRDAPKRARWTARAALMSYRILSSVRPLVRLLPPSMRKTMREYLLGMRPARKANRGPSRAAACPPGLNVIGHLTSETGVGESARLCRNACEAVGLPNDFIDLDRVGGVAGTASYRASIYHVNADMLSEVHQRMHRLFEASSYNIGCWHWELPELPDEWIPAAEPLDEIWAPSEFVQGAVGDKVTIPVVHMPHGIEVTAIEPCTPEELGVPAGRFTFLCMFDFASVMHRKNPLGAVEAFRRAFRNDSRAALLIKTVAADRYPAEHAQLLEHLRGVPDVYLTDCMLSRARVNGLLSACDSVISLHRSEGFGLILAEAMYLGKPVVATGWSGNMDFMNAGNSCPVGYQLITIDRTEGPYRAGQKWADPDLDHAAHLMRHLVDDCTDRARTGERAGETIRSQFSPVAAGLRYRRRLAVLGLMDPAR
ncbi:MAG: glycosyltransferase, partial [Thermoanaerobaculia bacterium]